MPKTFEKLPLIILAAGQSTRHMTIKGLLDFQGHPWLEEQIHRFAQIGGKNVILVLGASAPQYFEACPWLKTNPVFEAVQVLSKINSNPELGQFSSIQTGLLAFTQISGTSPL